MRLLSSSPKPPLNVSIQRSSSAGRPSASRPTRSRCFAFIAWVISLFSLATVVCINIGGVGWPLASHENPVSRLGNPGFELLQWFFDGPPPSTSIANFYHYRLSLNRLCAINPTRQRGYGLCYNSGPLGSFLLSQHSPDKYISHERAYDAVVGRIDLFTPFLFYLLAAACATASVILLPACIIPDGAGGAGRWHTRARTRAAAAMLGQALFLALASGTLTYSVLRLAKWMQYVPQVSHIWTGVAPLAMTWTSMGASAIAALVLAEDAGLAYRTRDPTPLMTSGNLGVRCGLDKRSRSRGRSFHHDDVATYSWEHLPQSAVEDAEDAWGIKSPRRRLGHGGSWSWAGAEVEEGVGVGVRDGG